MLSTVGFEPVRNIVLSDEYVAYVASLKNYKNGGYYTCSAKDIELYINYKLAQNND